MPPLPSIQDNDEDRPTPVINLPEIHVEVELPPEPTKKEPTPSTGILGFILQFLSKLFMKK
jgi:hypothetical protein